MSDIPSTIRAESAGPERFHWEDSAELHKCADGGGLFHNLKVIRRGSLPEDEQDDYAIQKDGDRTFRIGEIRALSRRADFPATDA
ncbi:hypothetical protein [uncultured Novosphingobium sp.]|uniref:hypothetical protein n=1 Tax=uncultured Novosphingobium sp. TaxID=292277 RepID=UPI002595AA8F|nr:hypothetical protein [uncultured Novosphingobium sp.]